MPECGIAESMSALSRSVSTQAQNHLAAVLSEPNRNLAKYSYEVIMDSIRAFQDNLDNDHEVAVQLASFGHSVTMNVAEVGYKNPNILIFYGYIGNDWAELIQNMSQLNFLLIAVKKAIPNKPPRRIGFASQENP